MIDNVFQIYFQKDGIVVFHSTYENEYLTKTKDGFSLSDSLYIGINDDMYLLNGTRIRECSQATIVVDNNTEYSCYDAELEADILFFKKKGKHNANIQM